LGVSILSVFDRFIALVPGTYPVKDLSMPEGEKMTSVQAFDEKEKEKERQ
jgi:hypothetical protein